MRFTADNRAFAAALETVRGAIRPSTVPILAHICIVAEKGVVTLRANNLDREIEARIDVEMAEEGAAALPGEILTGIVRRLPKGGTCSIAMQGDVAELTSRKSVYRLRSLPVTDFPAERRIEAGAATFSMDGNLFRDVLRTVAYPADESSPRIYCRGVHLHVHGRKLAATANDHHRLALYEVDLPAGADDLPPITIPETAVKSMIDLAAGAETVEIAATVANIELRVGDTRLTSALIECEYPDYRRVIPRPEGIAATVRPTALSEALERAATVYIGRADPQKLAPTVKIVNGDDGLDLVAGSAGGERGLENVEAVTNGHGLEVSVVTNYLAQMLKQWPETIDLDIRHDGGMTGVLFTSAAKPNVTHLIMPMRAMN